MITYNTRNFYQRVTIPTSYMYDVLATRMADKTRVKRAADAVRVEYGLSGALPWEEATETGVRFVCTQYFIQRALALASRRGEENARDERLAEGWRPYSSLSVAQKARQQRLIKFERRQMLKLWRSIGAI